MPVQPPRPLGVELVQRLFQQPRLTCPKATALHAITRRPGIVPLYAKKSLYRPNVAFLSTTAMSHGSSGEGSARIATAPFSLAVVGGVVATLLAIFQPSPNENSRQSPEVDITKAPVVPDTRDPSLPRFRLSTIREHGASHPEPWVTHGDKVYDITAWIPAHPGGDVILRAAGGSLESYWDIFTIHKSPHVREILAEYLIGYIDSADLVDGMPPPDAIEDPFGGDPQRDPRLITHTAKPRNAEAPAEWLTKDFLTPEALFYVRNHMWVPAVDEDKEVGEQTQTKEAERQQDSTATPAEDPADGHVLTVELPDGETKTYTLGELRRRFRHHTITAALQCAGNRRSDMTLHATSTNGLQWAAGAISNAEWEGVRLADVLFDAGLRTSDTNKDTVTATDTTTTTAAVASPDEEGEDDADPNLITSPQAHHVQLRGAEAYGASIPLPTALDPRGDVLLAFAMNGRLLARDHGFPLRALVPGHVAARSVKWLRHVAVADEESSAQWQRRDYKSFGPNEGAHPDWDRATAIQELPVTSAITAVRVGADADAAAADEEKEQEAGPHEGRTPTSAPIPVALQGYAYSGGGREIRRVDVSLDGGATWDQATLVDDCATPTTAATSTAPPCRGSRMWAWKRWTYEGRLDAASFSVDAEKDHGGNQGTTELQKPGADGGTGENGSNNRRCTTLIVKATDDAYNAQPQTHAEIYNVRGNLANAWHRVRVCPCLETDASDGTNADRGGSSAWRTGDVIGSGFASPPNDSTHKGPERNEK